MKKPLVYLLSANGLMERAVQLALQLDDYELARQISFQTDDDLRKRRLLLAVAIQLSQSKSVHEALQFVNAGGVRNVRVEDVLQEVKTKIDQQLKQEIKASMADYQQRTEGLRVQIEQSNSSTKLLAADLQKIRAAHHIIRSGQKCSCCDKPLLTNPFVVFACGHYFHQACAVKLNSTSCTNILKQISEMIKKNQSNDVDTWA